jgi:hypothetical protein
VRADVSISLLPTTVTLPPQWISLLLWRCHDQLPVRALSYKAACSIQATKEFHNRSSHFARSLTSRVRSQFAVIVFYLLSRNSHDLCTWVNVCGFTYLLLKLHAVRCKRGCWSSKLSYLIVRQLGDRRLQFPTYCDTLSTSKCPYWTLHEPFSTVLYVVTWLKVLNFVFCFRLT